MDAGAALKRFKEQSRSKDINEPSLKRMFSWQGDELLVTFNMTSLNNPTCTRLVPPLCWLSQHGAKVKVLHEGQSGDSATTVEGNETPETSLYYDRTSVVPSQSTIQLTIEREKVGRRLTAFRMQGFTNEDLFTMLDKGPWVLAFTSESLPKLVKDLKEDVGFNSSEVRHMISHCPYLVAQYSRFKGRDVYTSAMALMDAGYDPMKLLSACMRFPSMLAAPPDRIAGWMALIQNYGIARSPTLFSKLLSKATYMFYIDPPLIWDSDASYNEKKIGNAAVDRSEGTVAYKSIRIIRLLQGLKLHDLDKTIRTQPFLLLEDEQEVYARIVALKGIFADCETSDVRRRRVKVKTSITKNNDIATSTGAINANVNGNDNDSSSSDHVNNMMDGDEEDQTVTVAKDVLKTDDLNIVVDFVDEGENAHKHEQQVEMVEEDSADGRVLKSLRSMITTYPAVLSIDHYQIKACIGTLRNVGLGRYDIMQLIRRYPAVLGKDIETLKLTFDLLRERCGLRRIDLIPFISRHPSLLGGNFDDLRDKLNYFFKSLGGTSAMLARCPSFLVYDLDRHTRPRAEFLIAFGIDPLARGLSFLVSSSDEEIAAAVDANSEQFYEFCRRFNIQYVGNGSGNSKKSKLKRKDMDPDEYAKYFEKEGIRKSIEVVDLFPDGVSNVTQILSTVEA